MKGIVERFGGMWNGYTWIDQTTYLETAGRDALDQLLFIEAERMANGLYEPEECESERSVIISELLGCENDPDQLLDQEVTATAFRAHPYRHPTIGWLHDLQTMTRDDLYTHYRHYYVPNNATLVIAGDVDTRDALDRVQRKFGPIPRAADPARESVVEPPQLGERRVLLERPGTTGYMKVAWHAPAATDPDFFPMLVLDAVLTGAKGMNLWSSFRGGAPQRKSRLYTALVEHGIAATVSGALLPTAQPFLFTVSLAAMQGVQLPALESALDEQIDRLHQDGVTDDEVRRAQRQLRARFVFETDSVTNLGHQLGYFETVTPSGFLSHFSERLGAVTAEQTSDVARRRVTRVNRTVGWFQPQDRQS
jgi:zinc protease